MKNNITKTVYAFIDSQNLNLGIHSLGWQLDFARFFIYLKDKYHVKKAFIFIGYVPENADLYTRLQTQGYICVFKPTLKQPGGKIKGNVDAELVLYTMIEYPNFDKAILISGDGDFQCLAKYLHEQDKLRAIMIPNQKSYSALYKTDTFKPYLRFVSDLQNKVEWIKKEPPRKPTSEEDIFHS
jgi:uncharacterized LabA/DUF88 family protein